MNHTQDLIPQQDNWLVGIGKAVSFILLGLILLTACDTSGNNGVGNGNQEICSGTNNCNTNNTSNPGSGTQNPSSGITPIPTVAPTPTPLPYLVAKAGDVCQPPYSQFQASGWVPENNSFVFTGNGSNVVISPCNITTANYSVTATIMLLKSQLGVGVIAHADSGGQNGYVGGSGCRNISFGRCGFFINDRFTDIMDIDQEANLAGQTHTYKLVVNGITLQLFYDNNTIPIDRKSLATYPQAGYAGFECYEQCQVTGYTVTGI